MTVKEFYKEALAAIEKAREAEVHKTCPHCGYCPTCGRSTQPYQPWFPAPHFQPYWYYQPSWTTDTITISDGSSITVTNSDRRSDG